MLDNKLTDNEIIKALECCSKKICKQCPNFSEDIECSEKLINLTLDLINRLQAENEELVGNIDRLKEENGNLTVEFQAMRNAANGFKNELFDKTELLKTATAEIERLKETIEYKDICIEACEDAKSEAYKECIEKVKENSNKMEMVCSGALVGTDYTITKEKLDNLLKELVGENDAR